MWEHQAHAVTATVAEIRDGGRDSVTIACGTGKTLVGAEVSAQVAPAGRVLVVVPTLELVAQMGRAYAAHLGPRAGMIGAVCSDSGATVEAAEMRQALDELHGGSTTDPAELAVWLALPHRITVLTTYASLPVIEAAAALPGVPTWDLIIVDEAHRSAGREGRDWNVVHHDARIPARRRVYMTATPRIIGTDRYESISMDNTRVFGPEVYRLPFGTAIRDGLLADYQVVVAALTEQDLTRLHIPRDADTVTLAGQRIPLRTLVAELATLKAAREYGLSRIISYHHHVVAAHQFADTLPQAWNMLPTPQRPASLDTAAVDGSMTMPRRRGILARLQQPDDDCMVIANARVLGEGVDVPELDGVVFADPRNSVIDLVQAIGRALRRGQREGKVATIIVPVLVHSDEADGTILENDQWDPLWRVVHALRAHDERLADWLDSNRLSNALAEKSPAQSRRDVARWLRLPGPPLGRAFAEALTLRVIDHTTSVWLDGYAAATRYFREHGKLDPHRTYVSDTGVRLGAWVMDQRRNRRQGLLSANRISQLTELGIDWDPYESSWNRHITAARAYLADHGDLLPPRDYVDAEGVKLGLWLRNMRARRRRENLTDDRIAELDALGMVWDIRGNDAPWHRRISELETYASDHGHSNVPQRDPNHRELGRWLTKQRELYQQGKLPAAKVQQLEQLGVALKPTHSSKALLTFGLSHCRRV